MKQPTDDSRYEWTHHVWTKMQYYGISEGRIRRIIRFPARTEEGIAPETVAVMQPAGSKKHSEIWVMYRLMKSRPRKKSSDLENLPIENKKIKVITAWRYPGESPERDPIPEDIMIEIRGLL